MAESVQSNQAKSKPRSAAYPGFNIESSIEAVQTLRIKLGDGPYSREQAATELGYSGITGTSSTRIAACSHFGLLDRTGNTYSLSELAKKIIASTSEEEKISAIIESVKSPTLYSKLIATYDNQSLPTSLNNILDRNYGIISKKATTAATIFKESVEYAGVLHNGVISSAGHVVLKNTDTHNAGQSLVSGSPIKNNNVETMSKGGFIELTIPGTEVVVSFPERYAFNLTMGKFKDSIKALQDNIVEVDKSIGGVNNTDGEEGVCE